MWSCVYQKWKVDLPQDTTNKHTQVAKRQANFLWVKMKQICAVILLGAIMVHLNALWFFLIAIIRAGNHNAFECMLNALWFPKTKSKCARHSFANHNAFWMHYGAPRPRLYLHMRNQDLGTYIISCFVFYLLSLSIFFYLRYSVDIILDMLNITTHQSLIPQLATMVHHTNFCTELVLTCYDHSSKIPDPPAPLPFAIQSNKEDIPRWVWIHCHW